MISALSALMMLYAVRESRAQDAASLPHFQTRFDLHAGFGLPSGFSFGGRILTGRDAGIEASVGTLLAAFTLNAGFNFPAPSLFEGTRPSWSLLGTYFKGQDAGWYGITGMYGLMQLGLSGLHTSLRVGASLLIKRAPDGSVLLYPYPAIELGLAWGFPSRE